MELHIGDLVRRIVHAEWFLSLQKVAQIDSLKEEIEREAGEDAEKEYNLRRTKLNNMKISSVAGGEIVATELALFHIPKHIFDFGLMTESDGIEIMNFLGVPELPMEKRLGRYGAFEYIINAKCPTIDGKNGLQSVNLADDYLWVVHPQVEWLIRNNEKVTKKQALKIIYSGES